MHDVCNLPVLGVSLPDNDVCVHKLILVVFRLRLNDILLLELDVDSIAVLSD